MSDERKPVYRVSCAGCGEAHDFASMEELSAWGREHQCWQERTSD